MTAKASLCLHLLKGEVLNIKNVFNLVGLTNAPREISRMVEKPFGVTVFRTPRTGKSRYGQTVTWYDYRLQRVKENAEGIKKMKAYVQSQLPSSPRTQQELNISKQLQLL